jgi:hypothetical protein
MYYSFKNQYPEKNPPHRIRLPSGITKTDPNTFTEEDLQSAGWRVIEDPPEYDKNNFHLEWIEQGDIYNWVLTPITDEEKSKIIRSDRNQRINNVIWRVERNQREQTLGIDPTEDIMLLHRYIQNLADITKQPGFPSSVEWPEEPRLPSN